MERGYLNFVDKILRPDQESNLDIFSETWVRATRTTIVQPGHMILKESYFIFLTRQTSLIIFKFNINHAKKENE